MLYIFPDTNIFIHGKHFEQIDWTEVSGSAGITIMLSPSVITELDKHKYNSNKKIAQRVKKILPRIETLVEGTAHGPWVIKAILRRPAKELMENHHLDPKDQDDVLLASILEFIPSISTGDQVLLISNDTGPRLKGISLDIPVQSLPADYMMLPEADDTEKKIVALQRELDLQKNRKPIVSLQFANDSNYLQVTVALDLLDPEQYLRRDMEKIRKEFPALKFHEDNSMPLPNGGRTRLPIFGLRREQIDRYNKDLEEFFDDYQQYFQSVHQQMRFIHNACLLSIVLKNTGTVPAEDLDIYMHFPDGFDVVEKKDLPKLKNKPSPPHKPKNGLDFAMPLVPVGNFSSLIAEKHTEHLLPRIHANIGRPDIKKTNSYDVKVNVRSIKHNQQEVLEDLWLKYTDIRLAKGFAIHYKIIAANIPEVVTGKLHVNFVNKTT